MKIKIMLCFVISILLVQLVSSASPETLNQQQPYNCSSETLPLQITINELNQTIKDLEINLSYYENLSNYYKFLYESKEVNVTHGELIQIFNTLNSFQWNLNQTNNTLNDIKNKFSIFTFEVGISIVGVTGISVGLIELTLWYFKRRKKNGQPAQN